MSRISFAQNWEDVRLARVFDEGPPGFFVDVGAAHPTFHSFTRYLHDLGWHGINIEPLPSFFEALVAERPCDVNLCVAVADFEGSAPFAEDVQLAGSSGLIATSVPSARTRELTVSVTTLATICEAHCDQPIDVLKIDVEGAEGAVIAGHDWVRFPARVVVVEANHPAAWHPLLASAGYELVCSDGINDWFVREGDRETADLLRPPVSILDDFVPHDLLSTIESGELARRELERSGRLRSELLTSRRQLREIVATCSCHRGSDVRPAVLVALSSTNQLYSGSGRVAFENMARTRDDFEYEIAVDDFVARNVDLAVDFGKATGIPVHVGPAVPPEGTPDAGNAGLPALLAGGEYDAVECISWANAATNGAVLEHLGTRALVFTPHHQPASTVEMDERSLARVHEVYGEMLRRASVVCCDTDWEVVELTALGADRARHVPLGFDPDRCVPGPVVRPADLLWVGDHREPRKRLDRVFAVAVRLADLGVDFRLTLAGNDTERALDAAPASVRDRVRALGYVPEPVLFDLYRSSSALLVLSEFEAFGLPILEALACCTPVIVTDQPALRSQFGSWAGIELVDPDDDVAVAGVVASLLLAGSAARRSLDRQRKAMAVSDSWDVVARQKAAVVRAALGRHVDGQIR